MTTDTLERTDTGSFAAVRPHRPAVAPVSSGNPLTGWMPPSSWADEPTPLYDSIYPDQDHRDYTHADGVIRAAAKTERDQATLLAAWVDEHASWAAAEMREIVEPLAAEQAAQHAATTYAQLPPNPAEQLQPEALDAEHQAEYEQAMAEHDDRAQRMRDDPERYFTEARERARAQVNSHDGLARRAEQRGIDYDDWPDKWHDLDCPTAYDADMECQCHGYDGWPPDLTPPEPRRLLRDELAAFWADLRRLPSELRAWRPWKRGER